MISKRNPTRPIFNTEIHYGFQKNQSTICSSNVTSSSPNHNKIHIPKSPINDKINHRKRFQTHSDAIKFEDIEHVPNILKQFFCILCK